MTRMLPDLTMAVRALMMAPLLLAAFIATAAAGEIFTKGGVAIRGTDPVAYFTESRPVAGKDAFTTEWNGATWKFASADNLAKFKTDPAKYAPQFGGYCAWAVSQGYSASTVPEAWDIVDGKLYLNYSLGVQSTWRGDRAGNIVKGHANWPQVKAKL